MDHLLAHYERELARLRRSMATFAERYPKMAVRFGIAGDHCDDPHVERMLQSFALLAANIDSRLEDQYPEFSESLLELIYPQYMRPVPACSIARFDLSGLFEQITTPATVSRGTQLTGKTEECRFRTVYDLAVAPISIADASYRGLTAVPAAVVLPPEAAGLISIRFEPMRPAFDMTTVRDPVRVYVGGSAQVASTTIDTILLHTAAAFIEDGEQRWTPLHECPIAPAGWRDDERLIDEDDGQHALRLLNEYFAFPRKFDFLDIDLPALVRSAGSGGQLTLHVVIRDVHPDSQTAQWLGQLSTEHLMLFCTPIVNLFQMESLPLKRSLETRVFPVPALCTDVADGEIWSIDEVRGPARRGARNVLYPFTSLAHGGADRLDGPYWVFRNADAQRSPETQEAALGLVGLDGHPAPEDGIEQVLADVTYSNGRRPRTMQVGDPHGDLMCEEDFADARIVMLAVPTEPKRLPLDGDAPWRIIAHVTPHSLRLTTEGLDELKRLLRQFVTPGSPQGAVVDALKSLSHRPKRLWLQGEPMPSLVPGLEVTLAVDERAFSVASLSAFIGAMERFFALYVHENDFVELVVLSANTGAVIRRCEARAGTIPVV